MTLIISPLSQAPTLYASHGPTHVISLLSPGSTPFDLAGHLTERRLHLAFNDITEQRPDLIAPAETEIHRLLSFAEGVTSPMLIYCWAGISRSTAAGFILTCASHPRRKEAEIAASLRAASPMATPNRLMVALADSLLSRRGRMVAAIDAIGRGADAFEGAPFELA